MNFAQVSSAEYNIWFYYKLSQNKVCGDRFDFPHPPRQVQRDSLAGISISASMNL